LKKYQPGLWQEAAMRGYRRKMPSFLIGLICTPVAGLSGVLVVISLMSRMHISSGGDLLASLLFGSLVAAPTTLIGLPLFASQTPPLDPVRLPRLVLAGGLLGWLTMLGWLSLFGLVPKWAMWFGLGSRGHANMVSFVCAAAFMGALCGAISGAAIAVFGKDEPIAAPAGPIRAYLPPALAKNLGFIGLGLVTVVASWIVLSSGSSDPSLGFYRFKASYEVPETGEQINFDLVRPCDLQAIAPPDRDFFFAAQGFPKVTSRGHAIIVTVPRSCTGQTTSNGGVPADLLPFVAWFDDADSLSFGVQYTSGDAYKSPVAKIRFLGATIESAKAADFEDWKHRAGHDFRSSKRINHPFGFRLADWGGSLDNIPADCFGVKRIPLPPQLRELARAAWPEDHPRFWALPVDSGRSDASEKALQQAVHSAMSDQIAFGNGYRLSQLDWNEWSMSSPTAVSGAFQSPTARPVDTFPVTFDSYGAPFVHSGEAERRRGSIEVTTAAEWSGYTACYSRSFSTPPAVRRSLGDLGMSGLAWIVDGEDVRGKPSGRTAPPLPGGFFERDEFMYFRAEGPIR
jgi:hypothetical protein